MSHGIHHVTGITANVQANVDFYAGFLGLHLVKRTGGYEDAEQLHLFYGDAEARPGTLVSFLVWEAAGRGRTGLGQVSELAFAVSPGSIGEWLTKALSARIPVEGPGREFGEPVLRLKDPDGMIVKLVGVAGVTSDHPSHIHAVTLLSEKAEETAAFIARFGYGESARDGALTRLSSGADHVDIRAAAGFVPSIPGAGVADHVAFRAKDAAALREMRLALGDYGPTHVHDRKYFLSLYVREPGNCLIEYATDTPGMSIDEAPDALGQILFLPESDRAREEDLRLILPQFALPGEPRLPQRDLPFIHRFHHPQAPDGRVLILLHGTGGNEADLMPLAHRIAPEASLLGVRGRSTEENMNRWFRRFEATTFDQQDIAREAEAFRGFVEGALRGYGLDAERLCFIGYSNGANFLAAVMRLQPGLIGRAVLIRAAEVLEEPPEADLSAAKVLMLNGSRDPLAGDAARLAQNLAHNGAELQIRALSAGHELIEADAAAARAWLEGPEEV